ncbi:MAG: oxalurate catabolism protein HpxZ [Burkholderiales bacterium]|nr:oxalurate catabolism protein HpxZ [Burkholderiales bacterium]
MQINQPEVLAELAAAFSRYEAALVTNDIKVLKELFWNDSRTLRYGIAENLYGYDEICGYRDRGPAYNPARTVLKTVITTYGDDFGTTNIEFVRGENIGRQSQTWARMPEGWRIVSAHVSYMQGRPHP